MRILHTSDWHLGKKLNGYSRHQEQALVLEEICEIADREEVNAVLVAGDIFDTYNPPTEAVELFYKTVKKLADNGKRPVIAIAGNHDSPDRIQAPHPLASECGIIFAGYPDTCIKPIELDTGLKVTGTGPGYLRLDVPGAAYPAHLLFTPYANQIRLKRAFESGKEDQLAQVLSDVWKNRLEAVDTDRTVVLLISHLYITGDQTAPIEEPEDEKPIVHIGGVDALFAEHIPQGIQYTALGHLHRKQYVAAENSIIAYSGSPLAYSLSEENQDKFVLIADLEPEKEPVVTELKLTKGKKILRQRFDNIDTAVTWLEKNPDCLVELTIVSDTFLSRSDREALTTAHTGIIGIIPEVTGLELSDEEKRIDLNQSTGELFKSYFSSKNGGQQPDEELMDIFTEILAVEEEQ